MKLKHEKKYKAKVDSHSHKLADMERRLHKERIEARIIGWGLVIGIPLLNWFVLVSGAKYPPISPNIGPVDIILILTGFRFLWKGR